MTEVSISNSLLADIHKIADEIGKNKSSWSRQDTIEAIGTVASIVTPEQTGRCWHGNNFFPKIIDFYHLFLKIYT